MSIRLLARLTVLPLSAALVIATTTTANATATPSMPTGCKVSAKTMESHSVGMRTLVGRGVVTCSSIMRPQISINLRKGDTIKSRARKDCKREKKCTAFTDTIFRAQGRNWCTQVTVKWGVGTTVHWGCL
ncbi:hypothetical protein ABZ897_28815 [Nonomuraea sp. NPDC046802]|uniref:hypothetical protein n=1 Tax=Nonomuraea sp. NPDC046802 TaxID=3154919 RepID=UPI0033C136E3